MAADDVHEDLASELARRMYEDVDILYKNDGLRQRVVAACVDDGLVWSQILKLWRNLKVIKQWEKRIVKEARDLQGVPSIAEPASRFALVKDTWDDAPVADEASAPPGFGYGDLRCAIYKMVERTENGMPVTKQQPVSFEPIVITQRIQQKENSEIFFEVSWKKGNRWHSSIWSADTIFNNRKIVDCARQGLPVASPNAALVVEYLHAYEHHNLRQIAVGYSRGTMGWLGEENDLSHHGFMLGNRQLGANGQTIFYSGDCAEEFKEGGTFEGWRDAILEGAAWPSLRVALMASLAAPLVGIVGAPNVIIEWVSDTSGGKSVALRFARSAWCSAKTKLPTWNATVNGLEARAQCINDLPFFVDDTAQVPESKRRDVLGAAVYMLESGHTRQRATKELGQRPSRTWRTVVLSTGEYALADYVATGGAAARVLSFYGPPLGETSSATGNAARSIMSALGRHHGHAGPMFVQWLCDNAERWEDFERQYSALVQGIRKSFSQASADVATSHAGMRLAETIALLQLTSTLVQEALQVGWGSWSILGDRYILAAIERALVRSTSSANKARDAWHHVLSVASSKNSQWVPFGAAAESKDEPYGGWLGWRRFASSELGKVFVEDDGKSDLLLWLPSQLKSVLESGRYPVEATLLSWQAAGILISGSERLTSVLRCTGSRRTNRVYIIRSSGTAWDEAELSGTESDRRDR